jgi:hypothetical protein
LTSLTRILGACLLAVKSAKKNNTIFNVVSDLTIINITLVRGGGTSTASGRETVSAGDPGTIIN